MSTIDLALPPSLNRLWRSNRGRVHRAAPYVSWLRTAGWELLTQRPASLTGNVRITIAAGRPDRRRRDIDNLNKAVLDLLVSHGVIEDDSKVVTLTSSWDPDVPAGRVHVAIKRARASRRREATPAARGLDL
jgi:crossover junction endodeoxyribonuclease RusA